MQLPEFETLVGQLLSPDNVARQQAEGVYEQLKAHPDGVLELLLRCLRTSSKVENRQFCAIMLRKVRQGGGLGPATASKPPTAAARGVLAHSQLACSTF